MKFTSMCRPHGLYPIGLASLLLVLSACSHPVMTPKTPRPYDRTWWNATDPEQRAGFLAGYDDCALYDRHLLIQYDTERRLLRFEVKQKDGAADEIARVFKVLRLQDEQGLDSPFHRIPEVN